MTELGKLSHSRLLLRTQYYRDKTRHLEKKVQKADEKIAMMKETIKQLQDENHRFSISIEELKARMKVNQIEKLEHENNVLLKKIEMLSKEANEHQSTMEQKIRDYEQLLSEIQKEITAKEQELAYYQSKVKSLEKNQRIYSSAPIEKSRIRSEPSNQSTGEPVIAYFDYSIIKKTEQEWVVFGDFHIKNLGSETLDHPSICFRFSPPEASNLKGKILSLEQAEINQNIQENIHQQWMFLQSNWAEAAKERGEIWIASTEPLSLHHGETATLQGFQIPIAFDFPKTIVVEGFVYFSDTSIKTKSSNNIVVSS